MRNESYVLQVPLEMVDISQNRGFYIDSKRSTKSIDFYTFFVLFLKVPLLETHIRVKRFD